MKQFVGIISITLVFSLRLLSPQSQMQAVGNGRIAFSSDVSGRAEIYTVRLDGSDLMQLTSEGGGQPNWSPDGDRIAFVSVRDGEPEIYLMNADGSDQTKLLSRPETLEFSPAWSPDGTQIAFASQNPYALSPQGDICVINADGSSLRVVTAQISDSINFSPSWSLDGREILFLSDANTLPQSGALPSSYSLYVVGVEGDNPRSLGIAGDDTGHAEWSPRGDYIVYDALQPGLDLSSEIVLMPRDENVIYLLSAYEDEDIEPSWSPDGSMIVFSRFENERYMLYSMLKDGSGQMRVTNTAAGNEHGADWQSIPISESSG